jgi:ubiquinone/menaquinone biosynthesis C-methylase UbiE
MPDFSQRSTQEEIMDDLNTPEKELRINLHELEVVNEYLGGYSVVLSALDKMQLPDNISIMDIGSGGGDTLRAIAKWFRKKNKQASLIGIDWNDVMTKYAQEHSKAYSEISFRTIDIFSRQLDSEKADIVTCSLFCHHFEHNNLVELIKRMNELANKSVIINDLHRHWLAYYSIKILTSVFSKTYVVKNDAPLSVARALTRKEWIQVMQDAGISNYSIKWKWAFRWLIIINKPQA